MFRLGLTFFTTLVVLGGIAQTGGSAHAQARDRVVVPGRQSAPPAPPTPPPPTLDTEDEARQHVRGLPVPAMDDSESRKLLQAFERAAFGPAMVPPGGDVDIAAGLPRHGTAAPKGALPAALSGDLRYGSRDRPTRDLGRTDVRPDLDWLAGLTTGDIPVRWHPRVIRYLEFYKSDPKGRTLMRSWLERQGRFRGLIEATLARHRMPADLLYISMIESSYNPEEYSRAGAAGLWQFMPRGGVIYGLEIGHWVDERYDPVRATEAAALYWNDLYVRFGDWHLAMAAYNSGYGAVIQSINKYNTNDYWRLLDLENALTWGASIYVSKMLAASVVGHNRQAFGYGDIKEAAPFTFDTVTVPKSVTFAQLARAAGTSERTIADLNPALRRGRTPPGAVDYPVRVPAGSGRQFEKSFAQMRADWDDVDVYVMQSGERVEDVATAYGVSSAQLMRMNGIDHPTELHGGMSLVVPRIDKGKRADNLKQAEDDRYNATSGTVDASDKRLVLAVPDPKLKVTGRRPIYYRVVIGDSLGTIARALGVTVSHLAQVNGLDTEAKLQPKMIVRAFVPKSFDAQKANVRLLDESRLRLVIAGSPEHLDQAEAQKGRKRLKVIVQEGDTWDTLGRRYGLTKYDLSRINRRNYTKALAPGEELVVYTIDDVGRAKDAGLWDRASRIKAGKDPKKKPKASPRKRRR